MCLTDVWWQATGDASDAGAAGAVYVFVRQHQAERKPLGLHVLSADGATLLQKASFVKAAEISVEVQMAAAPLLLCPCCFKDEMEADLELEVLAPVGVQLTLSAEEEAKASTLETVASLVAPAAGKARVQAVAAGSHNKKAGAGKPGKAKAVKAPAASMHTAKHAIVGLAGLYGDLE